MVSSAPVERWLYRLCGINPDEEMNWRQYAIAALWFSVVSFVALYLLQRLQGVLPLNPEHMLAVSPDSSFNTAVSFVTNTNWQGYGGEATMSYLTQMTGLTVQNFVSAAKGMAVLLRVGTGAERARNGREDGNARRFRRPRQDSDVARPSTIPSQHRGRGKGGRRRAVPTEDKERDRAIGRF